MPESQEKVDAIASIMDYQDGGEVQHKLIQYLNQRAVNEEDWLLDLQNSDIPTTIIWGVEDPVAPTQVADYVWNSTLKDRIIPSTYWRLPHANHYLQNDRPEILSKLLRQIMGESVDFSDTLEQNRPILVGNSTGD